MREPAVVADREPLCRKAPCKKASSRVAVLPELIEGATDVVVPASEADAKPRSTSALASVASA